MPGLSDELIADLRSQLCHATSLTRSQRLCLVAALDEIEALRAQVADLPRLRAIEAAAREFRHLWETVGMTRETFRVLGVTMTAYRTLCEALGPEGDTDA